jgi:hypothetical protein
MSLMTERERILVIVFLVFFSSLIGWALAVTWTYPRGWLIPLWMATVGVFGIVLPIIIILRGRRRS